MTGAMIYAVIVAVLMTIIKDAVTLTIALAVVFLLADYFDREIGNRPKV